MKKTNKMLGDNKDIKKIERGTISTLKILKTQRIAFLEVIEALYNTILVNHNITEVHYALLSDLAIELITPYALKVPNERRVEPCVIIEEAFIELNLVNKKNLEDRPLVRLFCTVLEHKKEIKYSAKRCSISSGD